jgi:hypothetical protein
MKIAGFVNNEDVVKDMFKPYLMKLEVFDIEFLKTELNRLGIEDVITKYVKSLDCTRFTGDFRPIQTISYLYRIYINRLFYLFSNYDIDEDFARVKIDSMCDIHRANLEFEQQYPPINYDKRKKNGSKVAKTKEVDDNKDEETVAEKKLKLKVNKLAKLKFKFS